MIDRVIDFSIRHRGLVILAGLALALWGVYAAWHTPVDAIPDLSENQVIVFAEWPGHSPLEIEDQVTYPLALELQGLAGVRTVRSSSDVGFALIHLIFEDGVDFWAARRAVESRLAQARVELPAEVTPRLGPDGIATGQIYWYTVEGTGHDLGTLREIHDWFVSPQLASVPGVAEVASVGGYRVEYQVELDPQLLRVHGVALEDACREIERANGSVGGHVVEKGNAEYVARGVGWLGHRPGAEGAAVDQQQVIDDLEEVLVPGADGRWPRLAEVARISTGPQARRGVLEKDGNEAVGGVVLMRFGENPLEVTRRIQRKIADLAPGLPEGVRIVPCYDRTPLITGAIRTVTATVAEAMLTATICVVLVLLHLRTSLVIAITLPLAALASFAAMWTLRQLGLADIQTNIMSLAGIAVSIGVLVDSSIVMAENVMHALHTEFGDQPVRGDVRDVVSAACRGVGRPIFFSVAIMLLSFVPVFALGGLEGKMFRPLAFTKSFALASVAGLSITLVPALCTVFIRGRLRDERASWIVRTTIDVYRPVLDYLLDRPAVLAWVLGVTFLLGLAPLDFHPLLGGLFLATLAGAMILVARLARTWRGRAVGLVSLLLVGLAADQGMQPLEREFLPPLDEGMVMDMPITAPRAGVTQAANDLKARDMLLCRFPEVEMVVGKAGRAESAFDPAPLDMIETMVNFRPRDYWPRRRLLAEDARDQTAAVFDRLAARGLVESAADAASRAAIVEPAHEAAHTRFDAQMREYAYQRNLVFDDELARDLARFAVDWTIDQIGEAGGLARPVTDGERVQIASTLPADRVHRLRMVLLPEDLAWIAGHTADRLAEESLLLREGNVLTYEPSPPVELLLAAGEALGRQRPTFNSRLLAAAEGRRRDQWLDHVRDVNRELAERGAALFTRLAAEELLVRTVVVDDDTAAAVEEWQRLRAELAAETVRRGGHHVAGAPGAKPVPAADPHPALDEVLTGATGAFAREMVLWPHERTTLGGFGGELDRALQMPGWTNVWTMPIQNRVDMLATGVNTAVGIRVLGRSQQEVVNVSERIAAVVKGVPGAADVVADPIRGKGYLEVHIDRERAARLGVTAGDIQDVVETALAGKVVTTTVEGRVRRGVRVRFPREWREDEESVRNLLVPVRGTPLVEAADAGGGAAPSETAPTDGDLPGRWLPLAEVADVRIVLGPAAIKGENGMLRNYVRLNVRGRGVVDFVAEARQAVARQVTLPAGVHLEWTGQFEHEVRARNTLLLVVPLVVALIFAVLYWTYHDLADAALVMLAVPGALAGGVFFQWLLGHRLSVTVWVGYIACFGMATATGIIMLIYLREAVAKAGGLESMSLDQLRQAVMNGAVNRLRPKLLTEATTLIGLAPMLWATGPGAEVIRPMAAPVLGGILVADEVIDLFLPVLFYWVRRRRWGRLTARKEARPKSAVPVETVTATTEAREIAAPGA